MAREIIGCSPQELRDVAAQIRAMLKENGAPPQGKWADLEVLEPVRAYKNRHASTLLTFDAVEDCLSQLGV
jgi:NifU-like protein involved in Fe-S cluster formation